jgi:hypothetical protein
MEDDHRVSLCETYANVIIAEVKKSECKLNGPWTNPEKGNMRRVLKAVGCIPEERIAEACKDLYEQGSWSSNLARIRLFALGEYKPPAIMLHGGRELPAAQQLTWSEIILFIVNRLHDYRCQKSSVDQWPDDGKELRDLCFCQSPEQMIRRRFHLNRTSAQGEAP